MAYVTIRVWEDTRRLLRLIAAAEDEQMVEVMDRLCRQECERLGLIDSQIDSQGAKKNDAEASF
jgi:hypothetical protein